MRVLTHKSVIVEYPKHLIPSVEISSSKQSQYPSVPVANAALLCAAELVFENEPVAGGVCAKIHRFAEVQLGGGIAGSLDAQERIRYSPSGLCRPAGGLGLEDAKIQPGSVPHSHGIGSGVPA
eukprot:CAMPEP_0176462344 /NCGR_PEP_ID=MMETSP0127-20121128/35205_1 /TAXON_ID=938130 /ORGANISM="Platyophrya macrostoma, Strain WH" /LENGTH=122 /DNA_ID=CAMNT_0017854231 /DNA_START=275 /DNA_END=642 /DNA_ORIENTATION=-